DQGAGFLFGVLRGILLVAVAFFVYQTVLSTQDIAMVEDSRSAKVFARITGQLEGQDPEQTLSWITTQYEQLVGSCGVSDET
ncbi:MAG: CvpA family protein, partial [Pseudomonadota bacterium]